MKVLYITVPGRAGAWLAEAFASDSAVQILLEEASGTADGLARLRDEVFDAVLVSHEPGKLDALDLVEGYRAAGSEDPIVVLGNQSEQDMAVLCYEVGADGYVCTATSTTRNLIWVVARAMRHHQLARENQHYRQAEQTRLQRDHDEAHRLLEQQWAFVEQFAAESKRAGDEEDDPDGPLRETSAAALPVELLTHYRELLRVYVMMGSGNLASELRQLAAVLVDSAITAEQTARLHLEVVEEMVRGLGARSTRHVMTRADLLFIEVAMYLAEGYRRRHGD